MWHTTKVNFNNGGRPGLWEKRETTDRPGCRRVDGAPTSCTSAHLRTCTLAHLRTYPPVSLFCCSLTCIASVHLSQLCTHASTLHLCTSASLHLCISASQHLSISALPLHLCTPAITLHLHCTFSAPLHVLCTCTSTPPLHLCTTESIPLDLCTSEPPLSC